MPVGSSQRSHWIDKMPRASTRGDQTMPPLRTAYTRKTAIAALVS